MNDPVALLREIRAYNRGEGRFNFSRLPDDERGIASMEAWEEIAVRIDVALATRKRTPSVSHFDMTKPPTK